MTETEKLKNELRELARQSIEELYHDLERPYEPDVRITLRYNQDRQLGAANIVSLE